MSEFSEKMSIPGEHMQKIFGMQDAYLKKLERDFRVTVVDRNGNVVITGEEKNVRKVMWLLMEI